MEMTTEKRRSVKLRDDLHYQLSMRAASERGRLSNLLDEAVQQYLARVASKDSSDQVIRN